MNEYRAARIADGICVTCDTSVAGTGFKSCEDCRIARRKNRAAQVDDGRCSSCGQEREETELVSCNHCRSISAARVPQRRTDNLCSQCGKFPPIEGKGTCEVCTQSRKQKFKERYDKAQAENLCPHCLKPLIEGGAACAEYLKAKRKYNRKLKDDVFAAYGGYVCACCGITEPMFLQIDHIEKDGYSLRKEQGLGGRLYGWLRRHGFPEGYQVLCANCNHARSRRDNPMGVCPHKLVTTALNQAA